MNIFILHWIPAICAQYHVDKHVVKMILETTQLLCCAWHVTDPLHSIYTPVYKLAHKNHPSSKWTRESIDNYKWLCCLGLALCYEYTYRYGRIHKCQPYLVDLSNNIPPLNDLGFTKPKLAMPDEYKLDDTVLSYRLYYIKEKCRMFTWKKRPVPKCFSPPFKSLRRFY